VFQVRGEKGSSFLVNILEFLDRISKKDYVLLSRVAYFAVFFGNLCLNYHVSVATGSCWGD
jgi:hypothetical protein